jgi:fructose-bisphosphate aldolase class II/tagatose 1,6-diphosphate aldolase GatY/KbaY
MLVNPGEMLGEAYAQKRAIPSPDFVDSNSARAFTRTAEALGAPLILSFAEVHMNHLGLDEAADLGAFYAKRVKVPVALHLDHGVHFEVIEEAIRRGFTSVMIDASSEPLEENIFRTKEVVQLAHSYGVAVEAEIGRVGTQLYDGAHAESENIYTDVAEAVKLVEETGVDCLAVSIGTVHGQYKGEPRINFDQLAALNEALHIPLVLHGGSGSGDDNLARCAQGGIAKVNLYTGFIVAARDAVYEAHPNHWLSLLETGEEAMAKVLAHYYDVLWNRS